MGMVRVNGLGNYALIMKSPHRYTNTSVCVCVWVLTFSQVFSCCKNIHYNTTNVKRLKINIMYFSFLLFFSSNFLYDNWNASIWMCSLNFISNHSACLQQECVPNLYMTQWWMHKYNHSLLWWNIIALASNIYKQTSTPWYHDEKHFIDATYRFSRCTSRLLRISRQRD